MKKTVLTIAIFAAFTAPVFADGGRSTAANIDATVNADVRTGSAAQAANEGNNQNITVNMPATPEQKDVTTLRTIGDSTQRVITEGSTTTHQNVNYSGTQTVKNVPGVVVSGPASGPCNGLSGGIGVAVAGLGIGANFSKVDEGCEERETARIAYLAGRHDIGNLVLEEMAVVQRAQERREKRAAEKKAAAIAQEQKIAAEQPVTDVAPVSAIAVE